jgi:cbb3-type cytochrome oxidase maturation protein
MFYYLPWVLLIVASLWVSLAGFLWAFKSGQFSDQDRARYLPLRGEVLPSPVKDPAKFSREVYVLLALAGAVVFLLATVLIGIWTYSKGG